jgi:hypothetical protein
MVFGLGNEDAAASVVVTMTRPIHTSDSEVHRFGATRGKNDLDGISITVAGDPLSGILNNGAGGLTVPVHRRRVADSLERRHERLPRGRAHGR